MTATAGLVIAAMVSQWTLTGVQQIPPVAPGAEFACPKVLNLSDENSALKFTDVTAGRENALPPFAKFEELNASQVCETVSTGLACVQTQRDLNGDVWALVKNACLTKAGEACKQPDVRWTVTANVSQLVVRMDCKRESCVTPVRMGQCTYAWLKGEIRHGDGARHSDEDEHHHGRGGSGD